MACVRRQRLMPVRRANEEKATAASTGLLHYTNILV